MHPFLNIEFHKHLWYCMNNYFGQADGDGLMENCFYQGRMLCTFALKDVSGYYYEDIVIEWKEAAARRQLTCVECGAPVYLAAGPIKEPYFAHYDIEACDYGSGTESEELKKGKRLLYQLLKRSFPGSDIQARYRLVNGMYATLFCMEGEYRIAVDYRLQNTSLEKYRERDNYYQTEHIPVIYVLGKHLNKKTKQPDWYQTLIQKSMGYLAYLDTDKETLCFMKSISYRFGKERRFQCIDRTSPVWETEIDWNGLPKGTFTEECVKLSQAIEQDKLNYQKSQNQLRLLQEERERFEKSEQERMEAYRRRMGQEAMSTKHEEQNKEPSEEELINMGLSPSLYRKCLNMVREGNSHLVAAKYLEAIYQRNGIP